MNEQEKHIYMQDKMFPDWRKYWIYKNGKYTPKNRSGLMLTPNKKGA